MQIRDIYNLLKKYPTNFKDIAESFDLTRHLMVSFIKQIFLYNEYECYSPHQKEFIELLNVPITVKDQLSSYFSKHNFNVALPFPLLCRHSMANKWFIILIRYVSSTTNAIVTYINPLTKKLISCVNIVPRHYKGNVKVKNLVKETNNHVIRKIQNIVRRGFTEDYSNIVKFTLGLKGPLSKNALKNLCINHVKHNE